MAELGRKITCSECGAKFYDLGRADVSCPKCGHVPELADDGPATKRSSRRAASRSNESSDTEEPDELEVADAEEGDAGEEDEALDLEDGDEKADADDD